MLQQRHAKPVEVVADGKHAGMYRLRWADGSLSQWGYNLTRANDILRCFDRYVADMRRAEEMRARKLGASTCTTSVVDRNQPAPAA